MGDEPLFIFQPRSVLAIVSAVWVASGPILSLVLSLFALSFKNRAARSGSDAPQQGDDPFLQFSRAFFAAYAVVGMIVIPSFVYMLLAKLVPAERPDPFPAVLLINSTNLLVVFGYGLLCHFLAARMRALFDSGR